MSRRQVPAGAMWGPVVGYSRAVRAGNTIFVAGTAAAGPDGKTIAPGDAYAQTKDVLGRIDRAVRELGGTMRDIVRTRIFVTDISRWEEIGRAHGEVFGEIRPATSMVEVRRLIDPEMLVEIEAVAVVES
ncbi:MAG TPA: RidA family protein [bacterium]|nr:RidA family protein [bacterium]